MDKTFNMRYKCMFENAKWVIENNSTKIKYIQNFYIINSTRGVFFMKKVFGKVRPILVVLGIVVAGFLVCWGLLTLKVILFNA
jgi:hypothetical protein